MTEQAGVTTPVTDRPLTAEDVALLRVGDELQAIETTCTFCAGDIVTFEGPGPLGECMVFGMSWMAKRFSFHARPPSVSADPVGGVTSVLPGALHTALMDTIREDLTRQHLDAFIEEDDSELVIPSGCTPRSAFVKIDVSALADVALAALTPSPPVQLSERERAVLCTACEGSPSGENIPCAVCGANPSPATADKLREGDLWWNSEDWETTFDNIEDAYEAATNAEMRGVAALGRATQHETVYAVRIDIDTTGDGDADDWEIRLFPTRAEALATLSPKAAEGGE